MRYLTGWLLVMLSMGLAYVADWLCRSGAWLMDREDVYREHDEAKKR